MVPNPDGSQTPAEIQEALVKAANELQDSVQREVQANQDAYNRDGH